MVLVPAAVDTSAGNSAVEQIEPVEPAFVVLDRSCYSERYFVEFEAPSWYCHP